jgi:HEAT repeat protein
MFCAMGGAHAQPTNELSSLLAEFREASDFLNQLETAQKLVDLGDAKAVPPMEVWLEDEDRHVRGNAAFVLAGLGEQRGLAPLFEILDDYSDRPLGQGMPGIVGNTSVDGWWIRSQIRADRYYAVHLLGLLGNREAIPRLTVLASDPELSEKAAWALNEIRAGRSRK